MKVLKFSDWLSESNHHKLSKTDLINTMAAFKREFSAEGMSSEQKFDAAEDLVNGDQDMVDAIIKYHKVKPTDVQKWLADRI